MNLVQDLVGLFLVDHRERKCTRDHLRSSLRPSTLLQLNIACTTRQSEPSSRKLISPVLELKLQRQLNRARTADLIERVISSQSSTRTEAVIQHLCGPAEEGIGKDV